MPELSTRQAIYAVVRRIPRGTVATYGQVAELAGLPGHARQVGYALHDLDATSSVPWHRVVNARGAISPRAVAGPELEQRFRLEREGVQFDLRARIDLQRFRWCPDLAEGAGERTVGRAATSGVRAFGSRPGPR